MFNYIKKQALARAELTKVNMEIAERKNHLSKVKEEIREDEGKLYNLKLYPDTLEAIRALKSYASRVDGIIKNYKNSSEKDKDFTIAELLVVGKLYRQHNEKHGYDGYGWSHEDKLAKAYHNLEDLLDAKKGLTDEEQDQED